MKSLIAGLALTVFAVGSAFAQPSKPTIALVHGAFADTGTASSRFFRVTATLWSPSPTRYGA